MSTEAQVMEVHGEHVEVVRKDIKNLHLAVYPPAGRVRIAVPLRVGDEAVRLAVISRLPWIRRKQAAFASQERQSQREMVTGESHYFRGRRYRLEVNQMNAPARVSLRSGNTLQLVVRPGTSPERRRAVLQDWYRAQLREQILEVLPDWEKRVGSHLESWSIKKMRTRWGTCNVERRRIWLNLELAKKSLECTEYILAHELVHLLARRHDGRFLSEMDRVMPRWRLRRDELNSAPLTHEDWKY